MSGLFASTTRQITRQFTHTNTNANVLQTLRNDKNQLQTLLNNQIQKFNILQLQFNKNAQLLKNSNLKYIGLLSKYQQSNLVNSQLQNHYKQLQHKYNLLKQDYDNNKSWKSKYNQLYKEYLTYTEQSNIKYNSLFNERNRFMNQCATLLNDNNNKTIKYQSLQNQFNDLNNRYVNEKKEWMDFYKNQSDEKQMLQKHIRKIESELKQITLKYRKIIPETKSTNKSPLSLKPYHITDALSNINIILFENDKYYFGYDDTLKLFDQIISRFDCVPYKIKHCIECMESAQEYLYEAGVGGPFFERQQKQSVLTAMINVDDSYNITNKEIFNVILTQNKTNRDKLIAKSKHLRIMFNLHESTNICEEYKIEKVLHMYMFFCVFFNRRY